MSISLRAKKKLLVLTREDICVPATCPDEGMIFPADNTTPSTNSETIYDSVQSAMSRSSRYLSGGLGDELNIFGINEGRQL